MFQAMVFNFAVPIGVFLIVDCVVGSGRVGFTVPHGRRRRNRRRFSASPWSFSHGLTTLPWTRGQPSPSIRRPFRQRRPRRIFLLLMQLSDLSATTCSRVNGVSKTAGPGRCRQASLVVWASVRSHLHSARGIFARASSAGHLFDCPSAQLELSIHRHRQPTGGRSAGDVRSAAGTLNRMPQCGQVTAAETPPWGWSTPSRIRHLYSPVLPVILGSVLVGRGRGKEKEGVVSASGPAHISGGPGACLHAADRRRFVSLWPARA